MTVVRFVRHSFASLIAFGLDLLLLWGMVELVGVQYLLAATVAFLVAISLHYYLSRVWTFRGTKRDVGKGYVYFLIIAGVGLLITLGALGFFVEVFDLHYLIARVLASAIAGVAIFFLNARLNFRML